MNTIEVSRLSWAVLVLPCVCGRCADVNLNVEKLLFLLEVFLGFSSP